MLIQLWTLCYLLHLAVATSLLTEEDEVYIDNVLRSATKFKNLPPLKHRPKPSERTLQMGTIPSYVTEYGPLVHLYSEEAYLPYDIKKFVRHFHGEFENGTRINWTEERRGKDGKKKRHKRLHKHLEITDLSILQKYNKEGKHMKEEDIRRVFMVANGDFDADPEWITGKNNVPNVYTGEVDAPATLIVVDKGNGWIDAYWFYFYSFNLGPFVMGFGPYGNHVGDWEHSLVRFYKGEPVIVWMSAHGGGGAYFYKNLEKYQDTKHPIIFSARGTHANYPSTGQHAHDIPYSILSDFTDRGPLWNPTLNYLAYTFDGNKTYAGNGSVPFREAEYGDWLDYRGRWGDPQLDGADPRQRRGVFGWKYIDGPTGPLTKHLLRISPCQRAKWWNFWNGCNVRHYIKYGDGFFDKEGDNSCGSLYNMISSDLLRRVIEVITWRGWFCWIMDLIFG